MASLVLVILEEADSGIHFPGPHLSLTDSPADRGGPGRRLAEAGSGAGPDGDAPRGEPALPAGVLSPKGKDGGIRALGDTSAQDRGPTVDPPVSPPPPPPSGARKAFFNGRMRGELRCSLRPCRPEASAGPFPPAGPGGTQGVPGWSAVGAQALRLYLPAPGRAERKLECGETALPCREPTAPPCAAE